MKTWHRFVDASGLTPPASGWVLPMQQTLGVWRLGHLGPGRPGLGFKALIASLCCLEENPTELLTGALWCL